MLSRIADSMFWMNRYLERSEGLLRMMLTGYVLSLDKGTAANSSWEPLLNIFTSLSQEEKKQLATKPESVIHHLLLNPANNNSLKVILNRARENARGMQDHITKEMWEQVNQLYHLVNSPKTAKMLESGDRLATMEQLLNNCLLYTGITDSTMPRGMAWGFMNLGKYIERSQLTVSITQEHFSRIADDAGMARDILYWRSLLFTLSGYELHLKTYRSADTDRNVLNQVIFNTDFPHSVMYSLIRIQKYLDDLIDQNQPEGKGELLRLMGRLLSHVQYADPTHLHGFSLSNFLDSTQEKTNAFHHQLTQTFFSYS